MEIEQFGVIGSGQMGNGIAQVDAVSGLKVLMRKSGTPSLERLRPPRIWVI